jgi:hypothetical protein
MLRIQRNATIGALAVLALATASHRVAAQDTSTAGQAPQDTSAYTGGVSRDTSDTTLRTGVERVDSTARPSAADSSDTTKVGQTKPHRLKRAHRRIHAADTTQAAGARSAQPSGASDTSGMPGRRLNDSTRTGQEQSPEPKPQAGTSADSSARTDSSSRTDSTSP